MKFASTKKENDYADSKQKEYFDNYLSGIILMWGGKNSDLKKLFYELSFAMI